MTRVSQRVQHGLALAALLAFAAYYLSWHLDVPSLWDDEISTISATTRDFASLANLTAYLDAVHVTYYVVMHFWVAVFGTSALALRIPSVLATLALVWLTFELSRKLARSTGWTRSEQQVTLAGLIGGFFVTILPRTVWAAGEARSYAFAAAFGAALMLALATVLEKQAALPETAGRPQLRKVWRPYVVLGIVGTYFFMYQLLPLLAHGIVLAALGKNHRPALKQWARSFGIIAAASIPLVVLALIQAGQIGWLRLDGNTLVSIWRNAMFGGNDRFALYALCFIGIGLLAIIGLRKLRTLPVLLPLAVILVPAALLLAYSVLRNPIYNPRYLVFSVSALAVLAVLGYLAIIKVTAKLPLHRVTALAITVIMLAGITPTSIRSQASLRKPFAKGRDWSLVADRIHEDALPGDAILFGDNGLPVPGISRITLGYRNELSAVKDPTVLIDYRRLHDLYDLRRPVAEVAGLLPKFNRVWLASSLSNQKSTVDEQIAILNQAGFAETTHETYKFSELRLFTKR